MAEPAQTQAHPETACVMAAMPRGEHPSDVPWQQYPRELSPGLSCSPRTQPPAQLGYHRLAPGCPQPHTLIRPFLTSQGKWDREKDNKSRAVCSLLPRTLPKMRARPEGTSITMPREGKGPPAQGRGRAQHHLAASWHLSGSVAPAGSHWHPHPAQGSAQSSANPCLSLTPSQRGWRGFLLASLGVSEQPCPGAMPGEARQQPRSPKPQYLVANLPVAARL